MGTIGSGACVTDSCVDLIALLMNVRQDFCIELNNKVGMDNPVGIPPQDQGDMSYGTLFAGTYAYGNDINDGATSVLNNKEGCVQGGGDPATTTYHYYRVLLAR